MTRPIKRGERETHMAQDRIWLKGSGVFPDPERVTLSDAIWSAAWTPDRMSVEHVQALRSAAEAYRHLVAHPAGTESVIAQLREIRRALAKRRRHP